MARVLLGSIGVKARSLAILAALALGVSAVAGSRALAEGDAGLTCIVSWPEVRYRNYGYDHTVHLRSRCKLTAFCEVSSDVSPKPIEVVVAPRERKDVLVLRGSPTRQFTQRVRCWFRSPSGKSEDRGEN
jgi:hypothetical protein